MYWSKLVLKPQYQISTAFYMKNDQISTKKILAVDMNCLLDNTREAAM